LIDLYLQIQTAITAPPIKASSAIAIHQQLCGSVVLNGPTPDSVFRELSLDQILRHPVALELFKDCMIKEQHAEYIMLWLDCRKYKVCHCYTLHLQASKHTSPCDIMQSMFVIHHHPSS
jgi:hypothetical protein